MDFTKKEADLIRSAIKARNKSKFIQPVLFALLVIAFLVFLLGKMTSHDFVLMAVPLCFITLLFPQLAGSPKYHELVNLLETKLCKNDTASVVDSASDLCK